MRKTFKVGDRVRVNLPRNQKWHGQHGEIVYVNNDSWSVPSYEVRLDDGSVGLLYPAEVLPLSSKSFKFPDIEVLV